MKNHALPFAVLLFAGYAAAAAAQMQVEVITLRNRPLDQVIPIIQPLVGAGGAVTGMNNQLIVKSTPANLAEIKRVLQSLDTPMRRLLITVRQDVAAVQSRDRSGVEGGFANDNVVIRNTSPGGGPGVSVGVGDDSGNTIRWRGVSTRSNMTDDNDFRVQTVEGEPAFIQTGQSVPIANQNAYVTPGGVVVQDTVQYHDVTSGFYVIPRLSGDHVTLQIAPNLNRVRPGQAATFDVQQIETTVYGRLGEWISVGGLSQDTGRDGQSILSATRRRSQETRTVLIKVDEIR
jgi:type II secretory pathway component HofQ